jgi:hypothetical protein
VSQDWSGASGDFGKSTLGDITGDGLPDYITSYKSTLQNAYKNTASSSFSTSTAIASPIWWSAGEGRGTYGNIFAFVELGVRLMDVNGDLLSDIVWNQESIPTNPGGGSNSYLNQNGAGWATTTNPSHIPSIPFTNTVALSPIGAEPAEMNGDGFTDIFDFYNDRAQFGTGDGFASTSSFSAPQHDTNRVRIVDVNGDGLADLLYAVALPDSCCTPPRETHLNKGATGQWASSTEFAPPIAYVSTVYPTSLPRPMVKPQNVFLATTHLLLFWTTIP